MDDEQQTANVPEAVEKLLSPPPEVQIDQESQHGSQKSLGQASENEGSQQRDKNVTFADEDETEPSAARQTQEESLKSILKEPQIPLSINPDQQEMLKMLLEFPQIKNMFVLASRRRSEIPGMKGILPRDFLANPQRLETDTETTFRWKNEAAIIREDLLGKVDDLMERQNRAGLIQKMDQFEIETACRKVLKELVRGFDSSYKKIDEKQDELKVDVQKVQSAQTHLDVEFARVDGLLSELLAHENRIKMAEQQMDNLNMTMNKHVEALRQRIDTSVHGLDAKLNGLKQLETTVSKGQSEITKMSNTLIETRREMMDRQKDLQLKFTEGQQKLDEALKKLQDQLKQSSYQYDQQRQLFSQHSAEVREVKNTVESAIQDQNQNIARKVSNTDMQLNFKALNDLLYLKFSQVEDLKQAFKDVAVFQKYIYPLQVQMMMVRNFEQMEAAREDLDFQDYLKQSFDQMIREVEMARAMASRVDDIESVKHMRDLDKHHLREGAWLTEPLQHPDNDFVTPLINMYLQEIRQRLEIPLTERKNMSVAMRRIIKTQTIHDLVQDTYKDVVFQKVKIEEKEKRLKEEKIKKIETKKVSRHIEQKLGFTKKYAFKRQNSFNNKLGAGYLAYEDRYLVEDNLRNLSNSFYIDRSDQNKHIRDVTHRRQNHFTIEKLDPALVDNDSWDEDDYVKGGALKDALQVMGTLRGAVTPGRRQKKLSGLKVPFDDSSEEVSEVVLSQSEDMEKELDEADHILKSQTKKAKKDEVKKSVKKDKKVKRKKRSSSSSDKKRSSSSDEKEKPLSFVIPQAVKVEVPPVVERIEEKNQLLDLLNAIDDDPPQKQDLPKKEKPAKLKAKSAPIVQEEEELKVPETKKKPTGTVLFTEDMIMLERPPSGKPSSKASSRRAPSASRSRKVTEEPVSILKQSRVPTPQQQSAEEQDVDQTIGKNTEVADEKSGSEVQNAQDDNESDIAFNALDGELTNFQKEHQIQYQIDKNHKANERLREQLEEQAEAYEAELESLREQLAQLQNAQTKQNAFIKQLAQQQLNHHQQISSAEQLLRNTQTQLVSQETIFQTQLKDVLERQQTLMLRVREKSSSSSSSSSDSSSSKSSSESIKPVVKSGAKSPQKKKPSPIQQLSPDTSEAVSPARSPRKGRSRERSGATSPVSPNPKVQGQFQPRENRYVPMPADVRNRLFEDFLERLKPTIQSIAQTVTDKGTDPVKRALQSKVDELNEKIQKVSERLEKYDRKQQENTQALRKDAFTVIESMNDVALAKINRLKSDMDIRLTKTQNQVDQISSDVTQGQADNDALASAVAMLVENVNLQTEAEITDLIDRRSIQLVGGQAPPKATTAREEKKAKIFKPETPANRLPTIVSRENRSRSEMSSYQGTSTPINFEDNGQRVLEKNQQSTVSLVNEVEQYLSKPDPTAEIQNQKGQIISIDQRCLSHQNSSQDSAASVKLFKIACLNYKATDVSYRGQKLSRGAIIQMRRALIDKLTSNLNAASVFKANLSFPRRYFDDLVLEQQKFLHNSQHDVLKGIESTQRLKEMITQKLPFGFVSGRESRMSQEPSLQTLLPSASEIQEPRFSLKRPSAQPQPSDLELVNFADNTSEVNQLGSANKFNNPRRSLLSPGASKKLSIDINEQKINLERHLKPQGIKPKFKSPALLKGPSSASLQNQE